MAVAPVSAILYASTFVEWQVLMFWRFRFQFFHFRFLFFRFSFHHFFVLVLVFVNKFVIFSFFTIFVFVNENHTAWTKAQSHWSLSDIQMPLFLNVTSGHRWYQQTLVSVWEINLKPCALVIWNQIIWSPPWLTLRGVGVRNPTVN